MIFAEFTFMFLVIIFRILLAGLMGWTRFLSEILPHREIDSLLSHINAFLLCKD